MHKKAMNYLFLVGSMLPLSVLFSHFAFMDHPWIVYLISFCISMAILCTQRKDFKIYGIVWTVFLVFIFFDFSAFKSVLYQFYNVIVRVYNAQSSLYFNEINVDNTSQMMMLYTISMLHMTNALILRILLEKYKFYTCIVYLIACIFPVLIVSIDLHFMIMSIFFAYLFVLFMYTNHRDTILPLGRGILMFISGCILLGCVMGVCLDGKQYFQNIPLFDFMRTKINNTVDGMFAQNKDVEIIDLLEAKNRYYQNTTHLYVYSDKIDTYYLKHTIGSIYKNNAWHPLDENAYVSLSKEDGLMGIKFNSNYPISKEDTIKLMIEDVRADTSDALFPYFWYEVDTMYTNIKDQSISYLKKDVTFKMVKNIKSKGSITDFDYTRFVKANYLEIDALMEQFLEEQFNFESYKNLSRQEIDTLILDTLKTYTYTLTPGSVEKSKDFIQYFLAENKKGYCVHFASAATLMYRYFGIPARFVEGYIVHETSFKDENGQFKAKVLDKNAHAWVEIYDDKIGWIPVEATVGTSEEVVHNEIVETPSDQKEDIPLFLEEETKDEVLKEEIVETKVNEETSYLPSMMIGIIFIFVIYNLLLRLLFIIKIKDSDIQKCAFALYNHLKKLERYNNDVFNDEVLVLFEKNRFSKQGINEDELNYLLLYTKNTCKKVFSSISFWKKLKLLFVDCLL